MDIDKTVANLQLELQNPYDYNILPESQKIQNWAEAAYKLTEAITVTLRFVDKEEGRALNHDYRHKDYATNILSFAFDAPILPEGVILDMPLHLGDLVICLPVVEEEASAQKKSFEQHCAHLIVHGMLHLQGYDHIEEKQALSMEALEINILEKLAYPNPYSIT
ncbi:MAG TPA: rRNA maturation RNase YbeY [Leucothrix mucor]|nr:rRNA maturation RNase YbeY [Leucothrix mucor]